MAVSDKEVPKQGFRRMSQIRWAVAGLTAILASWGLVIAWQTAPGCPHDHLNDGPCMDLSTYHPRLRSGIELVIFAMAILLLTVALTWLVERRHADAEDAVSPTVTRPH
jgi:hypothetical protein